MCLDCPYCGVEITPDDCNDPDYRHEYQCPDCEKYFMIRVEWWPSFEADKAPCLNGGEHKYENIVGYPVEYFVNKYRCEYCDEETKLSPEEKCNV